DIPHLKPVNPFVNSLTMSTSSYFEGGMNEHGERSSKAGRGSNLVSGSMEEQRPLARMLSARALARSVSCAICLESIRHRGVLDGCPHPFCFTCIVSWSEVTNTCPLCKIRFHEVKRTNSLGKRIRGQGAGNTIKVPDRDQMAEAPSGDEDLAVGLDSELNGGGDRGDLLDASSVDGEVEGRSRNQDHYILDGFVVDDDDELEYSSPARRRSSDRMNRRGRMSSEGESELDDSGLLEEVQELLQDAERHDSSVFSRPQIRRLHRGTPPASTSSRPRRNIQRPRFNNLPSGRQGSQRVNTGERIVRSWRQGSTSVGTLRRPQPVPRTRRRIRSLTNNTIAADSSSSEEGEEEEGEEEEVVDGSGEMQRMTSVFSPISGRTRSGSRALSGRGDRSNTPRGGMVSLGFGADVPWISTRRGSRPLDGTFGRVRRGQALEQGSQRGQRQAGTRSRRGEGVSTRLWGR
ncbi:unnamed protein product, partial [Discosporangium mesarthrocarpum]